MQEQSSSSSNFFFLKCLSLIINDHKRNHTYHSINCHVQQTPWPHNGENPVDELKDEDHHFIFILGGRSGIKHQCNFSIIYYKSILSLNNIVQQKIYLKNCHICQIILMLNVSAKTMKYYWWLEWTTLIYLSSGWQQGWIIPFMSRYKLSNSTSLGFSLLVSTGIFSPFTSLG